MAAPGVMKMSVSRKLRRTWSFWYWSDEGGTDEGLFGDGTDEGAAADGSRVLKVGVPVEVAEEISWSAGGGGGSLLSRFRFG